ncbi:MAG: hypothetical protein AAF487_13870 [Bacteroidota bacterium]
MNSEQACDSTYARLFKNVELLESDTTAARLYSLLGQVRERAGLWDSIAENAHYAALKRIQRTNDPCLEMDFRFSITRFALFQHDPEETIKRAQKALEIANQCGEEEHIAHAYSFLGAAYIDHGSLPIAMENLQKSEKIYTRLNDSIGLAMVMLDKAIAYTEMGEEENAMDETKRAAAIYKSAGKELNYAYAMTDLCSSFIAFNQIDTALKYLKECELILRDKSQLGMMYINRHYCVLYETTKNNDLAIEYGKRALDIAESVQDYALSAGVLIHMSIASERKGNLRDSYAYALKSDSLTIAMGQNVSRLDPLRRLAILEAKFKNAQASSDYYEKYIELNDSLLGQEKLAEIKRLEIQFESEQARSSLALRDSENKLLQSQNKAARNRNFALAALLAVLVLFTLYLVRRKNNALRIKDLAKENLEQELNHKNKELTSQALQIAQKNELLENLKSSLHQLNIVEENSDQLKDVLNRLKIESQIDDNWASFMKQFIETNPNFYKRLSEICPKITKSEKRLASLLRMNLSSKEIALILNITPEGIKKARYRLRPPTLARRL